MTMYSETCFAQAIAEIVNDPFNTEAAEEVTYWAEMVERDREMAEWRAAGADMDNYPEIRAIAETTRARRHRERWEAENIRPKRDRLDHYC